MQLACTTSLSLMLVQSLVAAAAPFCFWLLSSSPASLLIRRAGVFLSLEKPSSVLLSLLFLLLPLIPCANFSSSRIGSKGMYFMRNL
eukprot:m.157313 g.157313  ORF g.157313 m.157313 type:complete len:87 (+) comp10226_c0_seq8:2112-2372(+)